MELLTGFLALIVVVIGILYGPYLLCWPIIVHRYLKQQVQLLTLIEANTRKK